MIICLVFRCSRLWGRLLVTSVQSGSSLPFNFLVVLREVLEAKENYLALPLRVVTDKQLLISIAMMISIAMISIAMMSEVHVKRCPKAFL